MVACHVAWSLFGTKTKIARIRSRDYTKQPEPVRLDRNARGADGAAGLRDRHVPEPRGGRHGVHRAADPLSGRAAGRRLRRRQGAARRPQGAQGRRAGRAPDPRTARPHAQQRSARGGHVPQGREHRARRRHRDRGRRRGVLRRGDAGHPRRHEGDAEARGPGEARRDRRRRQHRLPARADARRREPGQGDRARLEARAARSPSSCATRSCWSATPRTRNCWSRRTSTASTSSAR